MKIHVEGRERLGIADIGVRAQFAQEAMKRVRLALLAPGVEKTPPTFTSSQLAAIVGVESTSMNYRIKQGRLPQGTLNATGSRREFSLVDVQQWSREFRASSMRPDGAEAFTIAVANFKGGVSKTTTVANLAQGLSIRGHRVLVVDCDPQGSLTTLFGILPEADVKTEHTLMPLCQGEETSVEYAIRGTYWAGIDLVPASSMLSGAEFALPGRQMNEGPTFQFWNVLNYGLEQARQDYDVILIDTPPSMSYVTINAMMAANGIVAPIPPNALDFASSVVFWDLFYDLTNELGSRGTSKIFEFVNVLLTKVDVNDAATPVVREWIRAAYGPMMLQVEIPKTSTAATASADFGTVFDMKPGAAAIKTIKRATAAYEEFITVIEKQIVDAWDRQLDDINALEEQHAKAQ